MTRRSYSGSAEGTTLSAGASAGATTLSCVALVGWPDGLDGPFTITVDQDEATEEVILCDSITGSTITVLQRGYAGTVASAHSAGATVRHTACAVDFDEANEHVNANTGVHGVSPAEGSVVGTTKVQTLQNKTISSADNDLTISKDDVTDLVATFQNAMPVGAILPYAGSVAAPTGWLVCDGSPVNRVTYAALYTALGGASSPYGQGDGSLTFNLPNLVGRVPVGMDAGQAEFEALGDSGGAKTHTLTVDQMPDHSHTQNAHNHTQNAHTHVQDSHNHTQNSHNHTQNSHNHSQSTHSHSVGAGGESFLAANGNVFVSTARVAPSTGGSWGYVYTNDTDNVAITENGLTNNTTASNIAATATNNTTTGTNNAATATNQNATATNNPETAVNNSTGGGAAHNNLQPYLVLNYIIRALPAG